MVVVSPINMGEFVSMLTKDGITVPGSRKAEEILKKIASKLIA
jgi:hypothetical protein